MMNEVNNNDIDFMLLGAHARDEAKDLLNQARCWTVVTIDDAGIPSYSRYFSSIADKAAMATLCGVQAEEWVSDLLGEDADDE